MASRELLGVELIKDQVSSQLSGAGWDTSQHSGEVDSLAERISKIIQKVCDEDGMVRDANVPVFVKLEKFLGAGGQYVVFSGVMDFDRVQDYSQLWIPRRAHELMDQDGASIGHALQYARTAAKEAAEMGPEKVRREMLAFLKQNHYFPGGRCAVKVSYESITQAPRSKREAFTLGMHHPNIVYTLAEGKTVGNRIYRIMELIKDPLPHAKICSTLTLDELIEAVLRVAQVLDFIDRKGAVHRDIKPENILIGRGRKEVHPKVTDFGLMKLREFQEVFTFLTASSCVLLGTPEFIAPEQARNPSEADIRADLFCLGATAYYWWTGRSPNPVREDASPAERVHLKFLNAISREKKPRPPLNLGVSHDFLSIKAGRFQAILGGMLRVDPARRYLKPSLVVEDLERIRAGKKPKNIEGSLSVALADAFQGGYRSGRALRFAGALAAAAAALGGAYVACNEIPSIREALPDQIARIVPWYK